MTGSRSLLSHSRQDEVGYVAGAVLSGGASRRMGRPKALLPWPAGHPHDTFLSAILGVLRAAGISPLGVVSGVHHDLIAGELPRLPQVALLYNPDHEAGQLSSMKRALDWAGQLRPQPVWLMVALVDLPRVRPDTVRRLVAAAVGAGQTQAVRPVVHGRHGHPVLWHRDAWPRLHAAALVDGARPVIRAMAAEGLVLDVEVDDEGVLRDIDTPEDYGEP
jgi:molybdenum cofactor cytidylyltransferase